jgi:ABC-type lipoprotein release transport system permease subunit
MNLYLILAWRNLWRNRRRTLISTSSVFFAVFLALVMRSMENGSYDYMIESAVSLYTGYIQIHGKGYWDKRSLDQSISVSDSRLASFASLNHVTNIAPRLESFVLLSKDSSTRVAQVIGIDPEKEDAMTALAKRITSGRYLLGNDKGALIGSGLARFLGAGVGDSLVIYGQGFHGVTAAARVVVIGILKFPLPALDNSMVYLPLAYAQWLFDAPDRLTSIAFMVQSPSDIDEVQARLQAMTGDGTEVMTWEEMMPELVQSIEADSAGGILMLLILYIVIGFGIFGTVMTMTNERAREFGILVSIGMKRGRLIAITVIETILISLLGAGAGLVAGIPILWYLNLHPIGLTGDLASAMIAYGLEPILPFSVAPMIFVVQTLIVFFLGALCATYPFLVIRKLRPVAAMRA